MNSDFGLYLRIQWLAKEPNNINSELSRIGKSIFNDIAAKLIGTTWYRQERIGSIKPVHIRVQQVRDGQGWRREKLIEGQYMRRLVLTNGLAGAAQIGISGTLFEASPNPNQLVINLPEPQFLRANAVQFQEVLLMAEEYARALHGVAIVSSNDLFANAQQHGLKSGEKVAYAAFWGPNISREDPLCKRLDERGIEVPYSRIAVASWDDLIAPEARSIEAVQELLV